MHNVFPFSSLCNDNATLLSTELGSFKCVCCLCKHGPKFSQRNCNVIWEINVFYLNIFLVKEPNNILSIKPNCMWKANSMHFLTFITSKQMFKSNAFSYSSLKANTCISSTCCTIMHTHQYMDVNTRILPYFLYTMILLVKILEVKKIMQNKTHNIWKTDAK
jgi:hypothetical protein